jgi:hypothetical protein
MSTTLDLIREYLRRYGWTYADADADKLQVTIEGEKGRYLLSIHLVKDWLLLTVHTFVRPARSERQEEFNARLVKWNYGVKFARGAVDENGYLVIALDLPTNNSLPYQLFTLALDVLTYYAEAAFAEFMPFAADGTIGT